MNFSLQQLRHFVAVAEAGTLGKAARLVHVSQPALTKSIHKLEAGVGLRLFDRAGAMALTAVGREFLARARRLLEESGELERVVGRLIRADRGQVVVGCGPMIPEAYVAPAVSDLMRRGESPGVTIEIGAYTSFADQLRAGRLDFFVANVRMIKEEPDMEITAFPEEPAVWFARPGHPLSRRNQIPAAAFFSFPMVGPALPVWVDSWFQSHTGAPPDRPFRFAVTCSHYPTLKSIVADTDCVSGAIPSILSADFETGSLVPLDVDLPPLVMQSGVVTLRNRSLSPAARALVDSIQHNVALRVAALGWTQAGSAAAQPAATRELKPRERGMGRRPPAA
ncbi:MAG: LysR family transcriptional regulator [Verrucomicrobiales bacterium]